MKRIISVVVAIALLISIAAPASAQHWSAAVTVRQSAATTAPVSVWAIWNGVAGKTVVVTHCDLQLFFDGTAAATLMKYEMVKFTGVTAFAGGAAVTAGIRRGTAAPASAQARVLDTGLTLTGGTAAAPSLLGVMGRVTQTTTNFQYVNLHLEFADILSTSDGMELLFQEALAFRINVNSVIGDNLTGTCYFIER